MACDIHGRTVDSSSPSPLLSAVKYMPAKYKKNRRISLFTALKMGALVDAAYSYTNKV
jgi:hypothetical protein